MSTLRWTSVILLGMAPLVALVDPAPAQTAASSVNSVLQERIQPTAVTAFQLQRYLAKRIPKLSSPSSSGQWDAQERDLRDHILKEIAFHGWPHDWIEAPLVSSKQASLKPVRVIGCESFVTKSCPVLSRPQFCTSRKKSVEGRRPSLI